MSDNIKEVLNLESDRLPNPRRPPTKAQLEHNQEIFEWCSRQVKEFFDPKEYGEVFEYRRSEFDDEALITDYFRTEQPYHPIPRDEHFDLALKMTRKFFKPSRKLHPVAFPDLRYYPMTLNTNVEAPWNLRNWKFNPKERNVDWESEIPKLYQSDKEMDLWHQLFLKFDEFREERFKRWLENPSGSVVSSTVELDQWLAWKQELGLIQSNGRIKHNLYNEVFQYNRFLIHQIKDGLRPFWSNGEPQTYYWNTVHARSHVVGPTEPDKIRAVFGATWLLLMCELMFAWPLQSHYLNHPESGILLWGREIMRGGWKKIMMEASKFGQPETVLAVDWSQFDRRMLHELIDLTFEIWESYFDFEYYEETSFYNKERAKADPVRIKRLFDWIRNAIKHTPTLLPNGKLYVWTRNGFGSGYQFTQLMDSFVNTIMILTCLSHMGIQIDIKEFYLRVQGDDSLSTFFERMMCLYGTNFLSQLADCALYYFNAKLSVKKSKITKNFDGQGVLGYTSRHGLPYRTTEDLLSHFLFPESQFDNYDKKASVTVGLAYATCGTNERCYDFFKLCYQKMVSRGAQPHEKYLKWLVRSGILLNPENGSFNVSEFPDRFKMIDQLLLPHKRFDFESQRVWPTKPGPRGRFYFLEN
jgi:hypothetical protein